MQCNTRANARLRNSVFTAVLTFDLGMKAFIVLTPFCNSIVESFPPLLYKVHGTVVSLTVFRHWEPGWLRSSSFVQWIGCRIKDLINKAQFLYVSDDVVLWLFPKRPFLTVPATPVSCHYFYGFDKSSSCMIDFVDRFDRISPFTLPFAWFKIGKLLVDSWKVMAEITELKTFLLSPKSLAIPARKRRCQHKRKTVQIDSFDAKFLDINTLSKLIYERKEFVIENVSDVSETVKRVEHEMENEIKLSCIYWVQEYSFSWFFIVCNSGGVASAVAIGVHEFIYMEPRLWNR